MFNRQAPRKTSNIANLLNIYACAIMDLDIRFGVLQREIEHIQSIDAFVNKNEIQTQCNDEKSKQTSKTADSGSFSSKRQIQRLAKVASSIQADIQKDKTHITTLLDKMKCWKTKNEEWHDEKTISAIMNQYIPYCIASNIVLRRRSRIYISRLGGLRERLSQEMEHLDPNLQNPTLRRRQEYGLSDEYLKKMTFWAYRDIASTMESELHSPLPNKFVPISLQYWAFDHTSKNSMTISDDDYKVWRSWINKSSKDKITSDSQAIMIQLSYFMMDRSCLYPKIGHELSHRLIKDALAHLNPTTLQQNKHQGNTLARLARRIIDAIELYAEDASALRLTEEILADCLAFSRFGYAYLYAWFLASLAGTEESVRVFMDEYRRFDIDDLKHGEGSIEGWLLKHESLEFVPIDYLRGRALLTLATVSTLKADSYDKSLANALDQHCEAWLMFQHTPNGVKHWRMLASNIATAIKGCDIHHICSHIKKRSSKQGGENWFLSLQTLHEDNVANIKKHIGLSSDIHIADVCDIPWKAEWHACLLLAKDGKEATHQAMKKVKTCVQMGIEDYLIHVCAPFHLSFIFNKGDNNPAKEKPSDIRLLNPKEHKKEWNKSLKEILESTKETPDLVCSMLQSMPLSKASDWLKTHDIFTMFKHSSDSYFLSLYCIAAPEDNDRYGYYHNNISHYCTAEEEHSDACADIVCTALLGRYDAFVLEKISSTPHQCHRLYNKDKGIVLPAFARRKVLYQVDFKVKHDAQEDSSAISISDPSKNILALILIEVKSPVFRLLLLQWVRSYCSNGDMPEDPSYNKYMQQQLKTNMAKIDASSHQTMAKYISHVFLSRGWEDLVLVLSIPPSQEHDVDHLQHCYALIRMFYDHPMINRTQTLFTMNVLNTKSVTLQHDINYHFAVRVKGDAGCKEAFVSDYKGIADREAFKDKISMHHMTGRTDFLIIAHGLSPTLIRALRENITNSTNIERLETHLTRKVL